MAIEDAAALGILFSEKYFSGDVQEALAVYDTVRLPRVTRVQSAAAKAAYNINERIGELNWEMVIFILVLTVMCVGFSQNKNISTYKVEDEKKKLTIEEMNA
jgi:salicylate hydroxylase